MIFKLYFSAHQQYTHQDPVADIEICQGAGGSHDLRNLWPRMVVIFFLTSLTGPGLGAWPPWPP